jgi:hypothetical protein
LPPHAEEQEEDDEDDGDDEPQPQPPPQRRYPLRNKAKKCDQCGLTLAECRAQQCPEHVATKNMPAPTEKSKNQTSDPENTLSGPKTTSKPEQDQDSKQQQKQDQGADSAETSLHDPHLHLNPAKWIQGLDTGRIQLHDLRTTLQQRFIFVNQHLQPNSFAATTNARIVDFILASLTSDYAEALKILVALLQHNVHYMEGHSRDTLTRYDSMVTVAELPAQFQKAEEFIAKARKPQETRTYNTYNNNQQRRGYFGRGGQQPWRGQPRRTVLWPARGGQGQQPPQLGQPMPLQPYGYAAQT